MAKLPQDPSSREVLDRVIQLENDNTALATRVVELEKRATDAHEVTIKIIDKIGGIDEQVLELMEKNFPGHAQTQLQIIEIFKATDRNT